MDAIFRDDCGGDTLSYVQRLWSQWHLASEIPFQQSLKWLGRLRTGQLNHWQTPAALHSNQQHRQYGLMFHLSQYGSFRWRSPSQSHHSCKKQSSLPISGLTLHCVSTLTSCSFHKHGLNLIIFSQQHQHTFRNDMRVQLSLSCHFYWLSAFK